MNTRFRLYTYTAEIIHTMALNKNERKSPAIIIDDCKVCSWVIVKYLIATVRRKQMLQITATFNNPRYGITVLILLCTCEYF